MATFIRDIKVLYDLSFRITCRYRVLFKKFVYKLYFDTFEHDLVLKILYLFLIEELNIFSYIIFEIKHDFWPEIHNLTDNTINE